jgi:proline iminopeptidase
MDKYAGQKSAVQYLFPPIEPFDRRMLDVGSGHKVYMEQSGNPEGVAVVVLHGGPGGGSSPAMRRYFDPEIYHIILFDQRGCGRSTPNACVEDNTTWDLVADIERIRELLEIDKWIVFGGSWGATLALVYAETHPSRAIHLVLRGVFTMTQAELKWFYGGGAAQFWPETWARFQELIPVDERDDMIAAYHKRLFCGKKPVEIAHAKAWSGWENALAAVRSTGTGGDSPAEYALAFARLENHYFSNGGFLDYDGQILDQVGKIKDVPGTIVQGRYDMICPPATAYHLAEAWGNADLRMIPVAGHALSEPGISAELVRVMAGLAKHHSA